MELNKEEKEKLFVQYRSMIEKFVWDIFKGYFWPGKRRDGIDMLEELRQQAYLIFLESIERYDSSKAKFSTFLFSRLRTLRDYFDSEMRRNKMFRMFSDLDCDDLLFLDDRDFPLENFLSEDKEDAREVLWELSSSMSFDGRLLLAYLVDRIWETPGINKKPTYKGAENYLNYKNQWEKCETRKAWKEVKDWWRKAKYEI